MPSLFVEMLTLCIATLSLPIFLMEPMLCFNITLYQWAPTPQRENSCLWFVREYQKYWLANAPLSDQHFGICLLCLSAKDSNFSLARHVSLVEVNSYMWSYTSCINWSTIQSIQTVYFIMYLPRVFSVISWVPNSSLSAETNFTGSSFPSSIFFEIWFLWNLVININIVVHYGLSTDVPVTSFYFYDKTNL